MGKKIVAVNAGSRMGWNTETLFDPEAKKQRHETVFPKECEKAFEMGAGLVRR